MDFISLHREKEEHTRGEEGRGEEKWLSGEWGKGKRKEGEWE